MPVISPAGIATARRRNLIWVDVIADIKAPTVAELTSATTSLDISCYLDADWDGPAGEQSKETDERWCGNKFENMGDIEYTVSNLRYVVDPQATDVQGINRIRAFLSEGKVGYLVMRRGKLMDDPIVAGDYVDIYSVELGKSMPAATASNEKLKNVQAVAVTGQVETDIRVVA